MTTTIKFSPGEKVWGIINDKVQDATVESVTIKAERVSSWSVEMDPAIVADYHLVCGNDRVTKRGSEIAATKQELLASL